MSSPLNSWSEVGILRQWRARPYEGPIVGDKILRLYAQTVEFESGRVLLPRSAPWLEAYVRELDPSRRTVPEES
jgi:phage terminase large subunit-like protein